MGSKGSTTTNYNQSAQQTPNPYTSAAGQQALFGAQGAAQQPFWLPPAPVAGFSPMQQSAFQNINAVQGQAQPWYNQAGQFAIGSQTPITGADVSQYYNPMAANVTAQMQNIFGQQQAQNTGNLVQSAGGVGADRVAVGQANLANQQGLAAGQTYAGLYQQALQAAEAQKQQQANAAYAMGNLGKGAQAANLQGIEAQLGAGGLQQQLAQAQLQSPYNWLQQQFAYPYQANQYLAGIAGGLGPAMGGTTTGQSQQVTTPPQPSPISQLLGLGAAGMGMLGQSGYSPFASGGNFAGASAVGAGAPMNPFQAYGSGSAMSYAPGPGGGYYPMFSSRGGRMMPHRATGGTSQFLPAKYTPISEIPSSGSQSESTAPSSPELVKSTPQDEADYFNKTRDEAAQYLSEGPWSVGSNWQMPQMPAPGPVQGSGFGFMSGLKPPDISAYGTQAYSPQTSQYMNLAKWLGGKGSAGGRVYQGGGGVGSDPFGSVDNLVPNIALSPGAQGEFPSLPGPPQQSGSSSSSGKGTGQAIGQAAQLAMTILPMLARGGSIDPLISKTILSPPGSSLLHDESSAGGAVMFPGHFQEGGDTSVLDDLSQTAPTDSPFGPQPLGPAPRPVPFSQAMSNAYQFITNKGQPKSPPIMPASAFDTGELPQMPASAFEQDTGRAGYPYTAETTDPGRGSVQQDIGPRPVKTIPVAGGQAPSALVPGDTSAAASAPATAAPADVPTPRPRPDTTAWSPAQPPFGQPPGFAPRAGTAQALGPRSRSSVQQDTMYYANKYGVPAPIAMGLVQQESGFQSHDRFGRPLTSGAGAIGPAQLMPGTARGLGVNPYDPTQNIAGGMQYLRQQYDRFGNWPQALAAYNAGPGRVAGGGPLPAETQNYVPSVMANARNFAGGNQEALPGESQPAAYQAPGQEAQPSGYQFTLPQNAPYPGAGLGTFGGPGGKGRTLTNIGASIAGQASPWAGVNIGRGIMAAEKVGQEEVTSNQAAQRLWQDMQKHIDTMTRLTPTEEMQHWQMYYDQEGNPVWTHPTLGSRPVAPGISPAGAPGMLPPTSTPTQESAPQATGGANTSPFYAAPSPETIQQYRVPEFARDPKTGRLSQDVMDTNKAVEADLVKRQNNVREIEAPLANIFRDADQANAELIKAKANSPWLAKFLGPGPLQEERLYAATTAIAAMGEDRARALGISPEVVGALTSMQKASGNLRNSISRSMGAREPGFVIQMNGNLTPNWGQTEQGRIAVANDFWQQAQRDKDYAQFANDWKRGNHSDMRGMQQAFEATHPVQKYADRAKELSGYDIKTYQMADPNMKATIYGMPKEKQWQMYDDLKGLRARAGDPRAVAHFDRAYGNGLGEYLLQTPQ